MITVRFIDSQGLHQTVQAAPGSSLMQAATEHGVAGIVAECGGACSCATCQCEIDADWASKVGPADGMELAMLDAAPVAGGLCRLACQVRLHPALDGLLVRVPASQY